MSDEIVIEQKQSLGNIGSQIGQQIVYNGLTPEEASKLAIELFMDNFPKLQQQAMEKAEARINDFCNTLMDKLSKEKSVNYSSFMEPDVQYALYEAQNNYARFGTDEMLSTLSSLVAERVKINREDFSLKVTIDKAISIAGMLSVEQLNHLSLLFIVTKVKFSNINTINDLENHFKIITKAFGNCKGEDWQYLQMLGCLQLELPQIHEKYAEVYNLNIEDVKRICPKTINDLVGDYSTSPVGTILAITNANGKVPYKFDPKIWIHD